MNWRWGAFCLVVIVCVGLIVYQPALRMGFWTDDYWLIDNAIRLDFGDYLRSFFDPSVQWRFYRPMQGLQWWVAFNLFHADATGYHAVQLALHLTNAALLFYLVAHISRRWRLGFIAALVYVALSTHALAVFWLGVADPLVSVFYLLALALWLRYLDSSHARWYVFAFIAFVIALLSKEIAATLPVALFLADRLVVRRTIALLDLIKRYLVFAIAMVGYGALEFTALTRGVFTTSLGYGIGSHVFSALSSHLATLVFPWGLPVPVNYLWLTVVIGLVVYTITQRGWHIVFLCAVALLTMLPILPFPPGMALAVRYLYLPFAGSAIGVAIFFELARRLQNRSAWGVAIALGIAGLVLWNSAAIVESAVNFDGTIRQSRLQFRPIFQAFAGFDSDTLLYFFEPPLESPYISGMFALRYGRNVSVSANDFAQLISWRSHNSTMIFWQDDAKNWHWQQAAKVVSANATPSPPVSFAGLISLDVLEIARADLKPGDALIVRLHWRASQRMEHDYTIFVHLIDASGKMLGAYDSPPRQGLAPTSVWHVNDPVADGVIISIDDTIPPGEYRLAIGLYDPITLERLMISGSTSDQIFIAPITVGR